MVQQANARRTDRQFEEGTWVFLRLQPYRQKSAAARASQKLGKRFFGPFRILNRVGSVAYELELSPAARVHPVFHVSRLRPFHGDPQTQICPLPDLPVSVSSAEELERVPPPGEHELLIQWKGASEMEATWESISSFIEHFPTSSLVDKAFIDVVGIVASNGSVSPTMENGRPKRRNELPACYRT
ncbi:UNVERIFIED_CONTAM: hypothetical protein Sradi_0245300 [Sesamum radiatum]|uniref:Tf2-1-like SH3-like domain-containing protein n=1 Tax=Sesamum radiatum TaxID=300843 RepID=A0AAW2W268_SESRA